MSGPQEAERSSAAPPADWNAYESVDPAVDRWSASRKLVPEIGTNPHRKPRERWAVVVTVDERDPTQVRGTALGFRNLTNYIARSLLDVGGFRPHVHRHLR